MDKLTSLTRSYDFVLVLSLSRVSLSLSLSLSHAHPHAHTYTHAKCYWIIWLPLLSLILVTSLGFFFYFSLLIWVLTSRMFSLYDIIKSSEIFNAWEYVYVLMFEELFNWILFNTLKILLHFCGIMYELSKCLTTWFLFQHGTLLFSLNVFRNTFIVLDFLNLIIFIR